MNHWTEKYLASPWVSGARGPGTFDCWGLLWYVYMRELGIRLPLYPGIDANDHLTVGRMVNDAVKVTAKGEGDWAKIAKPVEFCAVGLGHRYITHVGVFTESDGGHVLHASEGQNVVADSLAVLKNGRGWKRLEFYQHGRRSLRQ